MPFTLSQLTKEQIESSKTWTELYKKLDISRYIEKQKLVQQFVYLHYPDCCVSNKRRYGKISDEEFKSIVANSTSARQIMQKGGWKIAGGTYDLIYKRIRKLNLDISHFVGQAHGRGISIPKNKLSLEEILVKDRITKSHELKLRLIKEGIKKHQCEICSIEEWQGLPTPISLDHINGDHFDNRIENLRILCPNCHAQTPTFAGKNCAKKREPCPSCGNPKKENRNKTCGSRNCVLNIKGQYKKIKQKKLRTYKINWPSPEKLHDLLWSKSTLTVAKELGISDVAISKYCKKHGISKPPRGYWAKMLSKDVVRTAEFESANL